MTYVIYSFLDDEIRPKYMDEKINSTPITPIRYQEWIKPISVNVLGKKGYYRDTKNIQKKVAKLRKNNYNIFENNLLTINKINNQNNSYKLELNKLHNFNEVKKWASLDTHLIYKHGSKEDNKKEEKKAVTA